MRIPPFLWFYFRDKLFDHQRINIMIKAGSDSRLYLVHDTLIIQGARFVLSIEYL